MDHSVEEGSLSMMLSKYQKRCQAVRSEAKAWHGIEALTENLSVSPAAHPPAFQFFTPKGNPTHTTEQWLKIRRVHAVSAAGSRRRGEWARFDFVRLCTDVATSRVFELDYEKLGIRLDNVHVSS